MREQANPAGCEPVSERVGTATSPQGRYRPMAGQRVCTPSTGVRFYPSGTSSADSKAVLPRGSDPRSAGFDSLVGFHRPVAQVGIAVLEIARSGSTPERASINERRPVV